jgi:hypothetical protein
MVDFLKTNSINNNTFGSINFFENSRLWLLKKYFFTNNLSQNSVITSPQSQNYLPNFNTNRTHITKLSFTTHAYLSNLSYLLVSSFTPSLNIPEPTNNSLSFLRTGGNTQHFNINLTTPSLDLLTGTDSPFFLALTSNTTNLDTTSYYSYTRSSTNTPNYNHKLPNGIKFYN